MRTGAPKYIIFFDRPNDRSSWNASNWVQQDLVDRYLDRYLPLANAALDAGMKPILRPSNPAAVIGNGFPAQHTRITQPPQTTKADRQPDHFRLRLDQRTFTELGAGGPECWPDVHPYFTPAESQDERGFRIFDWYRAIHQAVLHQPAQSSC